MEKITFILVFCLFLSFQYGWSNPSCSNFYQSSGYKLVLVELDTLYREMLALDQSGPDKSFLIREIKERLRMATEKYGPSFKDDFLNSIKEEAPKSEDKELALAERDSKARKEKDVIFEYLRDESHDEIYQMGPFLNDHEFFMFSGGDLFLYNYKTKTKKWKVDISSVSFQELKSKDYKMFGGGQLILTPDKSVLVIGYFGHFLFVDLNTKKVTGVYESAGFTKAFIRLSDDGKHFFVGHYNPPIFDVYDRQTLAPVRKTLASNEGNVSIGLKDVVQSSDGRFVFALRDKGSKLIDMKTFEVTDVESLPGLWPEVHSAVFLPGKDVILISARHYMGDFYEYDIQNKTLVKSKLTSPRGRVVVSQNGKNIITHGSDNSPHELFVYDSQTYAPKQFSFPNDLVSDGYKASFEDFITFKGRRHMKLRFSKANAQTYMVFFDLDSLTYERIALHSKLGGIKTASPDSTSLFGIKNGETHGEGTLIEVH